MLFCYNFIRLKKFKYYKKLNNYFLIRGLSNGVIVLFCKLVGYDYDDYYDVVV